MAIKTAYFDPKKNIFKVKLTFFSMLCLVVLVDNRLVPNSFFINENMKEKKPLIVRLKLEKKNGIGLATQKDHFRQK